MEKNIVLEDGKKYWLGACWGVYNAEKDIFITGNSWVKRWETPYRDADKEYNDYGCGFEKKEV